MIDTPSKLRGKSEEKTDELDIAIAGDILRCRRPPQVQRIDSLSILRCLKSWC